MIHRIHITVSHRLWKNKAKVFLFPVKESANYPENYPQKEKARIDRRPSRAADGACGVPRA